jgi:hypothetical protein
MSLFRVQLKRTDSVEVKFETFSTSAQDGDLWSDSLSISNPRHQFI